MGDQDLKSVELKKCDVAIIKKLANTLCVDYEYLLREIDIIGLEDAVGGIVAKNKLGVPVVLDNEKRSKYIAYIHKYGAHFGFNHQLTESTPDIAILTITKELNNRVKEYNESKRKTSISHISIKDRLMVYKKINDEAARHGHINLLAESMGFKDDIDLLNYSTYLGMDTVLTRLNRVSNDEVRKKNTRKFMRGDYKAETLTHYMLCANEHLNKMHMQIINNELALTYPLGVRRLLEIAEPVSLLHDSRYFVVRLNEILSNNKDFENCATLDIEKTDTTRVLQVLNKDKILKTEYVIDEGLNDTLEQCSYMVFGSNSALSSYKNKIGIDWYIKLNLAYIGYVKYGVSDTYRVLTKSIRSSGSYRKFIKDNSIELLAVHNMFNERYQCAYKTDSRFNDYTTFYLLDCIVARTIRAINDTSASKFKPYVRKWDSKGLEDIDL